MQQDNCPWHLNAFQAKWFLTHRAPKVQWEGPHRLPTGYSWLGPNYTDILLLGGTQGKKICQKKLLHSNLKFVPSAPPWKAYKGMKSKFRTEYGVRCLMSSAPSTSRFKQENSKQDYDTSDKTAVVENTVFHCFPQTILQLKQVFSNIHLDSFYTKY